MRTILPGYILDKISWDLLILFLDTYRVKLCRQLVGLHDRHFNISSWKPLSVPMNNCRWCGERLHCLVGCFLPGVVEEFSEVWFIFRAAFSLSFCWHIKFPFPVDPSFFILLVGCNSKSSIIILFNYNLMQKSSV